MDENNNEISIRVLIACEDKGKTSAERFFKIYNKMFEVEYNTNISNFELAFKYAKRKNMTHMLFFVDKVNLTLSSLIDDMGGYTVDVTVDDLEKVLSQNAYDNL